jgi:Recombinase zinc beta ribbon domain
MCVRPRSGLLVTHFASSTVSQAWRAKTGSVNVLSGAPFGYRYVRKTLETATRSSRTRPCWSRRCSAATPTTAPPSPACEEWTGIPVPALVDEETFDRVQQRLEDNKRFAARNTKVPSLLQGLAACASCGYGHYRSSATTSSGKKIYYYRCLGSDDYRYQAGRVCQNKPVRADYADAVVWDHVAGLLADPALIRAEIGKRLERARTSDPVTRKRGQLGQALAKTGKSIAAMVTAFSEQLVIIDELRARMPGLRAREAGLKDQIAALDAQAADRLRVPGSRPAQPCGRPRVRRPLRSCGRQGHPRLTAPRSLSAAASGTAVPNGTA